MEQPLSSPELHTSCDSPSPVTTAALRQWTAIVYRHKALLITGLILVYVLGTLYYLSQDNVYEARASVLVHRTGDSLPGAMGELVSAQQNYQNYLSNHIRLISSSAVLTKAASKLKTGQVAPLAEPTPGILASGLNVVCQPDTEILDITYRATDPRIPCAVVQSVVASYQECVNETHRSTSKDILQIFTQQKMELDRQLEAKERELVALQKAAGVLSLRDDKNNIVVARVTALNQGWTQARMHRTEVESRYQALKKAIEQKKPIEGYLVRYLDKLSPELIARSCGIQTGDAPAAHEGIRRQLLQDQQQLAQVENIYGAKHPKVLLLKSRISLNSEILHQEKPASGQLPHNGTELPLLVLRLLEHDLEEAGTLERDLQQQFQREKQQALDLNAQNAQLTTLEAELGRLRSFYDSFIQRMKQVNLGEDYGAITTQVIEPPRQPMGPVSPSLKKTFLGCTGLGIFLGVALCYLFEWWDTTYRGPEDISRHLGLPVLGHVPLMTLPEDGKPVELAMDHAPQSVEAEAFRTLRASLMLCDLPPKKFTITSSEPEDGKTHIVCNLAIAFAQSGLRTLLVDADMRRSRLHHIFKLTRTEGLSQLLQTNHLSEEHIEQAIRPSGIERLSVLSSGPNPPNPAELLISNNFGQFLAWAEAHFDRLIFDAPPILAVSDCAILGRVLDGTLLVVRADKSDRAMTGRAFDVLRGMNCRVLGVIVNSVHAGASYGYLHYQKEAQYYAHPHRPTSPYPKDKPPSPENSDQARRRADREKGAA